MSYIFEVFLNIKILIMNKKLLFIGLIAISCIFGGCTEKMVQQFFDGAAKGMKSQVDPEPSPDTPTRPRQTIKPKQTRNVRLSGCTAADYDNHEISLEVKQNGRIKTFYYTKNSRPKISLSRNSDVYLKVVVTGRETCGLKITTIGAQLAGGEKKGNSTFVNEQFKSSNTNRFCRAELREAMYKPLVVKNNGVTNRITVENCHKQEIILYITYI